ncbi:MAG: hypothetical protein SWH54_14895 [Thermodesulfobacteriota bacterium]|nr:hypothetical protein [Thermodesulfobacteriota bacterium]
MYKFTKLAIFIILFSGIIFAHNVFANNFEDSVYDCYQKKGFWGVSTGRCIANSFIKIHGYSSQSTIIKRVFIGACENLPKGREYKYLKNRLSIDLRREPNLIPIIEEHYSMVKKVVDRVNVVKKKQKEMAHKKRIEAKKRKLEKLKKQKVEYEKQLSKAKQEKLLDDEIKRVRAEKAEKKRVAEIKKAEEQRRKQKEKQRQEAIKFQKQQEEAWRQVNHFAKSKGCKGFYGKILKFYLDKSVNRIDPMVFMGYMFESIQRYKVVMKKDHIICYLINPSITFAIEKQKGRFYGKTLGQGIYLKLVDFGTFGSQQIFIFREIS